MGWLARWSSGALALMGVVAWVGPSGADPTAPAFSAEQLSARPREAWITNGGDLANERYSPLTDINTGNIAGLKAVWRAHLAGSGAGPRNSAEATPIFYDGVLYVATGDNDVFALDVASGQVLWTYRGHPEPKSGAPVGWSSRGVALGEGKVFATQIDAKLVALDQHTGQVLWSVQAEPWA